MEEAGRAYAAPLLDDAGVATAFHPRMTQIIHTELAARGAPIDRIVVTKAHGSGLPITAGGPDDDAAILIRPTGTHLVSLTSNDRRLVVNLTLELYERRSGSYRRGRGRQGMYLSRPLDGTRAIDRWAADGAALFWSELEQGMRITLATALEEGIVPAMSTTPGATTIQSANAGEEFKYRAWRRDGDLLFLSGSRDAVTIIHDLPAAAG